MLSVDQLNPKAEQFAKTFYDRRVYPMLTPVTVDPTHPFPHVLNKALCIAFLLRRRKKSTEKPLFGVVTVPRALPRLLRVPTANGGIHFVFLQDIISRYAEKLYRGYEILASAPFRVTRNSNLYLEEEDRGRCWKQLTRRLRKAGRGRRYGWKLPMVRIQTSCLIW